MMFQTTTSAPVITLTVNWARGGWVCLSWRSSSPVFVSTRSSQRVTRVDVPAGCAGADTWHHSTRARHKEKVCGGSRIMKIGSLFTFII